MFKIRIFETPSKRGKILVQCYSTYTSTSGQTLYKITRHCNFYISAAQAKEIKKWASEKCPDSLIIEPKKDPYPNYMNMLKWANQFKYEPEYPSVLNISNMMRR